MQRSLALLAMLALAHCSGALSQEAAVPAPPADPEPRITPEGVNSAVQAVVALPGVASGAAGAAGAASDLAGAVGGTVVAKGRGLVRAFQAGVALLQDIHNTLTALYVTKVNGGAALANAALDAGVNGVLGAVDGVAGAVSGDLAENTGTIAAATVNAAKTVAAPLRGLAPLPLTLKALISHLNVILAFLDGISAPSVADPVKAATLAPIKGLLSLLRGSLETLRQTLLAPSLDAQAVLGDVLGAASAIEGVLPDGFDGLLSLVGTAIDVLGGVVAP